MLVNLHIVQEDAEELALKGDPAGAYESTKLAFPLVCDSLPNEPQESVLYVMAADALPATATDASIACIGKPQVEWALSSPNVLYTEASDAQMALNCLMRIFERYRVWESRLLDLTARREPLQKFLECTGEMLGNPVSVMGSGFLTLASYVPQVDNRSGRFDVFMKNEFVPHGETLSDASIELLISDPDYGKTAKTEGLAIFPGRHTGAQALYQNIYEDGVLSARVLVEDVIKPFARRDYAIIATLTKYVEIWLQGRSNPEYDRPKDLDEVLSSLLSRKLLPRQKIASILDAFHWNRADEFMCITLKSQSHLCSPSELSAIVKLLIPLIGDCYGTYGDETVFVCNLTRLGMERRPLIANVIPALRDNLFTAGFSAQYSGFENLYYYYRQASNTLAVGSKKDPQTWFYRFEDYPMDFIMGKCLHMNISEALAPEGLRRLAQHDADKGTDYVNVLRSYLDHERNVVATAQAVYSHRSTLRYQLSRIEEILEIDLDDPDQRLWLQIALRAQQVGKRSTIR